MKQAYTPLHEITAGTSTLAEIVPDFVSPESIGVNFDHLSKLAMWGGFYDNPEIIIKNGPTSRQVGGFTENRGLHKTAVITNMQPVVNWQFQHQEQPGFRERVPLKFIINPAELTLRAQQHRGGALRNPSIWAHELHKGFAGAVIDASKRHLTGSPLPRDELIVGGATETAAAALGVIFAAQEVWSDQPTVPFLIFSGLTPLITNFARAANLWSRESKPSDGSYSLIPGWQYDRLAVVRGLSHVRSIAKALPTGNAA